MKIIKLVLILLLLAGGVDMFSRNIISAGGSVNMNASGSISYAVGKLVISTTTETNKGVTEGTQKSGTTITAVNELSGEIELSVFPNPASDFVKLKTGKSDYTGLQYRLYDINGKLLHQKQIENNETDIPFGSLSPSTYYIRVYEGGREMKAFKVVKN